MSFISELKSVCAASASRCRRLFLLVNGLACALSFSASLNVVPEAWRLFFSDSISSLCSLQLAFCFGSNFVANLGEMLRWPSLVWATAASNITTATLEGPAGAAVAAIAGAGADGVSAVCASRVDPEGRTRAGKERIQSASC